MSGVDWATLQGFAVPVTPGTDHTYVASSCGLRWGCFGRDYNGAMICTGFGSSKFANCLSQVDSKAGIIYGISGVCHQAADRILYPAGQTVALAGGFPQSVFFFGVYGLFGWPEKLSGCLPPPGGGGAPTNGGGGQVSSEINPPNNPTRLSSFNKSISMAHEHNANDESVRLAELTALVELRLGRALDGRSFAELARIQAEMRNEQLKLQQRLAKGDISPDQYLSQFYRIQVFAMLQIEKLLGPGAFSKIFGSMDSEQLIDPKRFLEEHRPR